MLRTQTTIAAGSALVAFAGAGAMASSEISTASVAPSRVSAAMANVQVGDFFFHPAKIKVKVGTTVHWMWIGMKPHNVTFTKLHKRSHTQTTGTYRLKFTRAGTYRYLCTIHGFTGTVVVR